VEGQCIGNDVLGDGEAQHATLQGYSKPIFDRRLVDSKGDRYTFRDINVSLYDVVVTREHLE